MARRTPHQPNFKIQRAILAPPGSEAATRLLAAQERAVNAGRLLDVQLEPTKPDTWHITLLRGGVIGYAFKNTTRQGLSLAGLRQVLTDVLPNRDSTIQFMAQEGYGRDASYTKETFNSAYGLQVVTHRLVTEKRALEKRLSAATGVIVRPGPVHLELAHSVDRKPPGFKETMLPELVAELSGFSLLADAVEFVPLPPPSTAA